MYRKGFSELRAQLVGGYRIFRAGKDPLGSLSPTLRWMAHTLLKIISPKAKRWEAHKLETVLREGRKKKRQKETESSFHWTGFQTLSLLCSLKVRIIWLLIYGLYTQRLKSNSRRRFTNIYLWSHCIHALPQLLKLECVLEILQILICWMAIQNCIAKSNVLMRLKRSSTWMATR